ncbi:hypothetical protein BC831DRAFT_470214 [Entophlyctis helioformis]|nr:hypothetical protein BC831DRAFT_470214 [Entophlyctis helioformis]
MAVRPQQDACTAQPPATSDDAVPHAPFWLFKTAQTTLAHVATRHLISTPAPALHSHTQPAMPHSRPDFAKCLYTFPSTDAVSESLANLLAGLSSAAIARSGVFTVALSGGSLPATLAARLAVSPTPAAAAIDFSKWVVLYADERCVPLDHADSNHAACAKAFLASVPIPPANIIAIHAGLVNDPAAAAADYAARLAAVVKDRSPTGVPRIDAVLLGMGPDGHTCSLFPGHALLDETRALVAAIFDSPKPPPSRITLTYPVVNAAHNIVFVTTGAGKADIFHSMVDEGHDYPSARVNPTDGNLYWFLDTAAASKLTTPTLSFKL